MLTFSALLCKYACFYS